VTPLNQGWAIACYLRATQIYSEGIIQPKNLTTKNQELHCQKSADDFQYHNLLY